MTKRVGFGWLLFVSVGAVVALAMILIATFGCTSAVSHPVTIIRPLGGARLGGTGCDIYNQPYIAIDSVVALDRLSIARTIVHENAHILQILRFKKGCREFLARYNNDDNFRFSVEVGGYCAEVDWLSDMGANRALLVVALLDHLATNVAPHIPREEILNRITCKEVQNETPQTKSNGVSKGTP